MANNDFQFPTGDDLLKALQERMKETDMPAGMAQAAESIMGSMGAAIDAFSGLIRMMPALAGDPNMSMEDAVKAINDMSEEQIAAAAETNAGKQMRAFAETLEDVVPTMQQAINIKAIAFLEQEEKNQTPTLINIPTAATLYFFATHTDIEPTEDLPLSDEIKDELLAVYKRLKAFYAHYDPKKTPTDALVLLRDFTREEEKSPSAAAETLDHISTLAIVPELHSMPNHKLVNALTHVPAIDESGFNVLIDVSKNGAKNVVTSSCLLTYEGDNLKITGRQPFTQYDRAVYDAVTSLWIAGNRTVTADMICREMVGKTEQEKPSQGQKSAVTKSLEKMRFTRATINCGDEFAMRRIQIDGSAATGGYDENLLYLRGKWLKAGKHTIRGYDILSAPVLYEYSRMTKQIISVPVALLDVKKRDKKGEFTTHSLDYKESRVLLKSYLLRRIEGMKGKNGLNNHCIALKDYEKGGKIHEGLYTIAGNPELSQPAEAGATDAERTKRKNDARYIRDDVELILDYWKAGKYIKGYKPYKAKGSTGAIAGYEIIL